MSTHQDDVKREQLLRAGYCLLEGVLDGAMVEELRHVTDVMLADYSRQDAERFRYQGSNISISFQHPVFPRLFVWPKALAALAALGFDQPKWWSGFLLSKP